MCGVSTSLLLRKVRRSAVAPFLEGFIQRIILHEDSRLVVDLDRVKCGTSTPGDGPVLSPPPPGLCPAQGGPLELLYEVARRRILAHVDGAGPGKMA